MSYIKREAVLKIIGDNCPHDKCGYNTEEEMGAGAACHYIMKDVENIPTADVVEVVRCKDCKYYEAHGNGKYGLCKNYKGKGMRNATDYCSYGERREE